MNKNVLEIIEEFNNRNRIEDVINSKPGYIPTSEYDIPKYKNN